MAVGATTAEMRDQQRKALPDLECDLVMKGGVTSGVVYPSAVTSIARHYRLRSIGGTSAGAIAAAAAAAMEFGRTSGRNPGAADQLQKLPLELGVKQDGKPLLLRLFSPDPGTRPLFNLILAVQALAAKRDWAGLALFALGPSAAAGLILSGVLIALLLLLGTGRPGTLQILLALLIFFLLAAALALGFALFSWGRLIIRGVRAASGEAFGFCSGMAKHASSKSQPQSPSLGQWLHDKFQSLAGLPADQPLCFGDLWIAQHRTLERSRAEAFQAASAAAERGRGAPADPDTLPREIDLALVASDITRAQSLEFPFLRREDRLYVRLVDLRTLYPKSIVDWMIAHAGASELEDVDLGGVEQNDLIRLPPAEHLPILFAVRPSLSFPILFRAVRLYLLRRRPGGLQILSPLWFADGGITSNFPVHLFDAPIPTRPTFCINLLYADDELQPDERPAASGEPGDTGEGLSNATDAPPDELVYMLRTNWGRLAPYTALPEGGAGGLLRFASRVVSTARQWNDNQLLDVPGYRDRIVHVRMRTGEGGFNLDMGSDAIADLQKRGQRAGDVIARRFLPDASEDPLHPRERLVLNWANHRMARFRSFLAGLELTASRFARAWEVDHERAESPSDTPGHAEPSVQTMSEEAGRRAHQGQRWGYPFRTDAQADMALEMVKAVTKLTTLGEEQVTVDFLHGQPTSPRPKQRLVLRAPLNSDPLAERLSGARVPRGEQDRAGD